MSKLKMSENLRGAQPSYAVQQVGQDTVTQLLSTDLSKNAAAQTHLLHFLREIGVPAAAIKDSKLAQTTGSSASPATSEPAAEGTVTKLLSADLANYPKAQLHLLHFLRETGVPVKAIKDSKLGQQVENSIAYKEAIRNPGTRKAPVDSLGL